MLNIAFADFAIEYLDTSKVAVDTTGQVYYNDEPLLTRGSGYLHITLPGYQIPIHWIVAYIKYGHDYLVKGIEARHLNNIKSDNSWDNIAIGTHKDNMNDLPMEVWQRIWHTTYPDTAAKRSAGTKRYWAAMTQEQRTAICSHNATVREANMSAEDKSRRSKKGWDNRSDDAKGKVFKEAAARISPEDRSARSYRGWETRRAKKDVEQV